MAHSHSDHANIDTLLQKTGSAVAVAPYPISLIALARTAAGEGGSVMNRKPCWRRARQRNPLD
jgi:L-ascorbate metabolism protein UlaG (beta-lactamase superfamily)